MKVIHFVLVLGVIGSTRAQKAPKHGQGHKGQGHGGHQGQGDYHGGGGHQGQAEYHGGGQNQHQGNHGGHYNAQPFAAAAKPTYPLLLSDSRTLNNDGTINFQYAADNGLQQGETVDPDGTRRGFYSYPGADGKPITVKYTAGKNGFIAEGSHLPKQPIVPGHSDKDELADNYSGKGHSPQQAYRPHQTAAPIGSYEKQQEKYHLAHAPAPQYNHGGAPAPQYNHGGAPAPQYNHGGGGGPPRYNAGGAGPYNHGGHRPGPPQHSSPEGQDYQGISPAGVFGRGQGFDFGPVNYGAPSQSSNKYKLAPHSPPKALPQGGQSVGQAFSGFQQEPAGPYNGQFDLGNGGQFSINFNPGQSREVSSVGGDYSRPPSPY